MHWENNNNKLCDLLYWDNHFTVVIWIPICSISEVNQYTIVCCSYFLYTFPSFILDIFFSFFLAKIFYNIPPSVAGEFSQFFFFSKRLYFPLYFRTYLCVFRILRFF